MVCQTIHLPDMNMQPYLERHSGSRARRRIREAILGCRVLSLCRPQRVLEQPARRHLVPHVVQLGVQLRRSALATSNVIGGVPRRVGVRFVALVLIFGVKLEVIQSRVQVLVQSSVPIQEQSARSLVGEGHRW